MHDLTNKSQNNGKFQQWLAAIIVNISAMGYGISLGWTSPMSPLLKSDNLPVGETPLTDDQISWVSSLLPMGCCISIPFSGILAERFGRKTFGYITGLLLASSWLLIIFGTSHVNYLYVARLIAGMSSSMSAYIVPLYVSEIASEEIRGALCSFLTFSVKTGILFAYIAGPYLSYFLFNSLALIFPIVFVVTFAFIPETPVYLARKNRLNKAHKSLMFFRANNRPIVEEQLANLKPETKTIDDTSKKINFAYLLQDRATRKGLCISLGVIAAQQFCGMLAMITYAETIFKKSGSSIPPEIAAITLGVIQVLGSYIATILMERAGRRLLSMYSSLGMAISHFAVGLFMYLHDNEHNVNFITWLPVVGLSTFVLSYCIGIGQMPWIVTYEFFHHEVSTFACTICFTILWAMSFFIVKAFDSVLNSLRSGCFFILASFCLAGFVFVYLVLPETKGRTREDIVDELAGIAKDSRGCRDKDDCCTAKEEEIEKMNVDEEKIV